MINLHNFMSFKEAESRKKSKYIFIAFVILTFLSLLALYLLSFKLPPGVISLAQYSFASTYFLCAVIGNYIIILCVIGPRICICMCVCVPLFLKVIFLLLFLVSPFGTLITCMSFFLLVCCISLGLCSFFFIIFSLHSLDCIISIFRYASFFCHFKSTIEPI